MSVENPNLSPTVALSQLSSFAYDVFIITDGPTLRMATEGTGVVFWLRKHVQKVSLPSHWLLDRTITRRITSDYRVYLGAAHHFFGWTAPLYFLFGLLLHSSFLIDWCFGSYGSFHFRPHILMKAVCCLPCGYCSERRLAMNPIDVLMQFASLTIVFRYPRGRRRSHPFNSVAPSCRTMI
jgi:hypothetical protein